MKSNFLDKMAGKWLSNQDRYQALKKLGERRDWKSQVKKCHERLSEEYKFWTVKSASPARNAKLEDLSRDIKFIKVVEQKESLTAAEKKRLQEVVTKYNLN